MHLKLKHSFLFIVLITFLQINVNAINIDSLKKVIPTLPDDTTKLRLLNAVFITISNKGDFNEAFNYGNQALSLSEKLNDQPQRAKTIHQFGLTYRNMGKYDMALEKLFEALKIREQLGFKKPIAVSLNTIGSVYGSQKKYKKAQEYINQSIQIFKQENDSINIILPLSNLATLYADQHKLLQAIPIFKNVLHSFELRKDTNNIVSNNYNIGMAFKELKQYDSAMIYLSKAQELADKIQLKIVQSSVAAEISEILLLQNETEKAKQQIEHGLIIAEQTGDLPSLAEIYKHKVKYDSITGDYKGALNSYVTYSKLKDSMVGENASNNVEHLGMKYEFDKKIDAQKKQQETIIRNRNIGLIILGIITFFSFLLFRSYRKRQQAQKQLEIEQTRNKISRDLHDELGSDLSSVSMQANVASRKIKRQEDVQDLVENIGTVSQEMVSKMSDIVWSLQAINENTTQLIERISNYCASIFPDYDIQFNIENKLTNQQISIEPDVLKELYLIIKEALNNSLKHAACSLVKVEFSELDKHLQVVITDNGKGFDIKTPSRTMGGNGLKNIKQRAERIHGNLNIQSTINEGTLISIAIPIK